MDRLRIAIVGCGSIAEKHVRAITELKEEAKLAAICDIDAERLEQFASGVCKAMYPEVQLYTTFAQLLSSDTADLVVIATSSGSHAALARQAIRAGKHVLVEKPLALTMEEAQSVTAEAQVRNVVLAVSFQARYLPQMLAMKEAVQANKFGTLTHGNISMRWQRSIAYYKEAPWREDWLKGGGLFMNQCIHYIDLLLWLMGPAATVYAQGGVFGQAIGVENMGAAIVRFHNGAIGIIEASNGIYPYSIGTSIALFGDKGSACIEGDRLNEVKRWVFHDENSGTRIPRTADSISHIPLYRDLVQAIRTDKRPLTSADTSLAATELVLAIYQSMATGKRIELPLKDFTMQEMAWMG
ncbi:Gfo/Idh/MocA family protein [Paenibacillus chungangensis]|uniref:Gfo/Idh/MocA family protein n=1 Tax=Paenibacillus chungangensis TaxID=696535 RepID=A0ABW3HLC1_9BACL